MLAGEGTGSPGPSGEDPMTTETVCSLQRERERATRKQLTPTITTDERGFVKIVPGALLACHARLMDKTGVSASVAWADLGELLVLLVDTAGLDGRVAPKGGWRKDACVGYHQNLVAAEGWDPRRHRLVRAGGLLTDDFGRVLRIDPAWRRQLTNPAVVNPDGTADQLPYVVVQRTRLREVVGLLRQQTDARGRTVSGVARLLPWLVLLCTPLVSVGPDGLLRATQRELAASWRVSLPTVNAAIAKLVDLGLLVAAERQRGPNAKPIHLFRVGATSDWLAGRTWTVAASQQAPGTPSEAADDAGQQPETAAVSAAHEAPHGVSEEPPAAHTSAPSGSGRPDQAFNNHRPSVQEPPIPSGGVSVGFPVEPSSGNPTATACANRAAGGGSTSGQKARWVPGPSSRADRHEQTRHAVAMLPVNAPALRELVGRYDGRSTGRAVRTAVLAELRSALTAVAAWAATGHLPADAERDRVDAIARLARVADALVRVGTDATPALVYEDPDPTVAGSYWFRPSGQLDPHKAVVLLLTRLRPFAALAWADPRFAATAGNWRKRAVPAVVSGPAVPGDADADEVGAGVDVFAAIATVGAALTLR